MAAKSRPPTPDKIAALLASYRASPPSAERPRRAHVAAARAAGCDWQTARRAWTQGWPAVGVEALSVLVQREQVQARGVLSLATKLAAATTAAVEDGAQQRAAEALTARAAGSVAAALLGELLGTVAPQVRAAVAALAEAPPTAATAMDRLRGLVDVAQRVVALAGAAQQQERLALGEPGAILGLVPAPAMTPEQAAVEIAAAQRALALVQQETHAPSTGSTTDPASN